MTILDTTFALILLWIMLMFAVSCGDANKVRIHHYHNNNNTVEETEGDNKFTVEEFCYQLYDKQPKVDKCIKDLMEKKK